MHRSNPYRSPSATILERGRPSLALSVLAMALYVYPLLIVSAIYIAWLLSSLALGHMPAPYREYPDNPAISFFAYSGFFLILAGPIAIPAGLFISVQFPFAQVTRSQATTIRRFVSLTIYVLILLAAWTLLYSDPWRVVDWYLD